MGRAFILKLIPNYDHHRVSALALEPSPLLGFAGGLPVARGAAVVVRRGRDDRQGRHPRQDGVVRAHELGLRAGTRTTPASRSAPSIRATAAMRAWADAEAVPPAICSVSHDPGGTTS